MKLKKEKILILLAFIGLVLSFLLLLVDMNAKSGIPNTACNISNYINCDKIAVSSYAHVFGIPTSLIGMFFFFFVAFYGIFSKNAETFYQISFWLFGLASLVSLFLLVVSVFEIKALCIFCTGTYIINWICLILLKNHYKPNFTEILSKKSIEALIFSILFAAALSVASFFIFQPRTSIAQGKDPRNIIEDYKKSETYTLNLMLTPYTGSNNPKVDIIVYSDFFCSHCRHFMTTLDQLLSNPKYKENVRVYYKTFPLDNKKCNESATVKDLSASCKMSLLSFELLKKGLFWEFETKTRENPLFNQEEGIRTAEELNRGKLDLNQVKQNNMKYVVMNMKEAQALGVMATPTWFLNGKKFEGSYEIGQLMTLIDFVLEGKQ